MSRVGVAASSRAQWNSARMGQDELHGRVWVAGADWAEDAGRWAVLSRGEQRDAAAARGRRGRHWRRGQRRRMASGGEALMQQRHTLRPFAFRSSLRVCSVSGVVAGLPGADGGCLLSVCGWVGVWACGCVGSPSLSPILSSDAARALPSTSDAEQQRQQYANQPALAPSPMPSNVQYYSQQSAYFPGQPIYQHLMPTPVASPQPIHHRPTILIEKQEPQLHALDTDCSPATPALSACGSSDSSPPSSVGFLPTPVNGTSPTPESLPGVKQGCEVEVFSEILAGNDFPRSQSPPLTPSKFYLRSFYVISSIMA
ncbi:MAG: hypothetical protein Q9159_000816 [Coniocarpon cinnabarinum]